MKTYFYPVPTFGKKSRAVLDEIDAEIGDIQGLFITTEEETADDAEPP